MKRNPILSSQSNSNFPKRRTLQLLGLISVLLLALFQNCAPGMSPNNSLSRSVNPSKASDESRLMKPTLLSASGSHTCFIQDGGRLMCWGQNGDGQLGDGSTTSSPIPKTIISSGVRSVSTFSRENINAMRQRGHTCAIVAGGALQCWGDNEYGQLGDGSTIDSLTPKTIISTGVTSVAAGAAHSCAVVSGSLKCWGSNWAGQLGDGSTIDSLTPKTIISTGVASVTTGEFHTCALVSGALQCWGDFRDESTTSSSAPQTIISSGVTSVSSGRNHTCAVVSGSLKCWGNNWAGQLGDGSKDGAWSGSPKTIIPSGVIAVSAGAFHTCAIVSGGALQCWGHGLASTPITIIPFGVTSISAGAFHTCAIVSGGALQCWGNNEHGQLGDGSTTDSSNPKTIIQSK